MIYVLEPLARATDRNICVKGGSKVLSSRHGARQGAGGAAPPGDHVPPGLLRLPELLQKVLRGFCCNRWATGLGELHLAA